MVDPANQPIHLGRAREGEFAGKQPIHGAAETEQVGALVHLLSVDLLGRHVIGCADRKALVGVVTIQAFIRDPDESAQSQVQNLDDARIVQEQVRGLDVAMDDPFFVCVRQTLRDLDHPVDDLLGR